MKRDTEYLEELRKVFDLFKDSKDTSGLTQCIIRGPLGGRSIREVLVLGLYYWPDEKLTDEKMDSYIRSFLPRQ